jgi:hypothetical protein
VNDATIEAEGEPKGNIITFQLGMPVAHYQYYLWRGNCYGRSPAGNYVAVPSSYCS